MHVLLTYTPFHFIRYTVATYSLLPTPPSRQPQPPSPEPPLASTDNGFKAENLDGDGLRETA
ncbi:UNVERIFIED_CONTAM: hypothetical protein Slati_0048400 [Sesamum latifolium]|uniref:Uncharacterized protein n=1 Tax=Sesamum latifolium TaxID=2727402 RepID=A0AAW2Y758_9LAMI